MTTRKTTTGTSQGATDRPGLPDAEPAPLEERVVSIADLSFGQSPRIVPEDIDHARMLAEVNQVLPPILVNAETMVVIDGRHRVLAARLRGETSIRASLFHGTDDQAYLLGVRANTTHGKPLSLPERLQAASRILKTTPSTSDRTIARVCGLSPRTVAARRTGDPTRNATKRVGADGRARPLSSSVARRHAAELILAFPDDSNRKIAHSVGLSETTVRDVRRRLMPVEPSSPSSNSPDTSPASRLSGANRRERSTPSETSGSETPEFAIWLAAHSISETSWTGLLKEIPLSRCQEVIGNAVDISNSWRAFAVQLERRVKRETT